MPLRIPLISPVELFKRFTGDWFSCKIKNVGTLGKVTTLCKWFIFGFIVALGKATEAKNLVNNWGIVNSKNMKDIIFWSLNDFLKIVCKDSGFLLSLIIPKQIYFDKR